MEKQPTEKDNSKDEKNDDEEEKDPNLVDWDGPDDNENPKNFAQWRKRMITATTGIMTFTVTSASSVFSIATDATSAEFGVSTEVMTLGTALFVLGFAWGPII